MPTGRPSSRRGARRPAGKKAGVRPSLEGLEARLVLSSTSSIPVGFSSWAPIGPAPLAGANSGRITAIAGDPTDAKTIYIAAAGGGVWKTTNAGDTWTPLTDAEPSLAMGALAVAPSNPQIIYAGTGEANNSGDSQYGEGILKSIDGGQTWTQEDNNGAFDRKTTAKIVVSPTDPNTVYAAIDDGGVNSSSGNTGIWKSTDGGKTWTNTTTSISKTVEFSDVVLNPTNPLIVYAAAGTSYGDATNGVYESTDGGTTWAAAGNFPIGGNDGRIALTISPSSPSTLYAAIAVSTSVGGTAGQLQAMEKTTDGGQTWTALTSCPNFAVIGQGWYDLTVAVDPSNPNIVYGAGVIDYANNNKLIVESQDGGATWIDLTYDSSGVGPHTDIHALDFDANGKLLLGGDGGIWRLDNNSAAASKWTDLNTNLQITQFTDIALDPTDPTILYGGSQDNGTEKFGGSAGWPEIYGGDGGYVAVDPNNPQIVYCENFGISLHRSEDGGQTWTDVTNGINNSDNAAFYVPFVADPTTSGRLVYGTDHIYETTNYGDSWKIIGSPGVDGFDSDGQYMDSVAISKSDPNTIYATGSGIVLVTHNDGASWNAVLPTPANDLFSQVIVDPTNSDIAYLSRDAFNDSSDHGHVLKTTDGGKTWTDISGTGATGLPDIPADSIAMGSIAGLNFLWVGTDRGVYDSTDGGQTWSVYAPGMPNVQVVSLDFSPSLDLLAAGTHGRGAFEIKPGASITVTTTPPVGVTQDVPFSGVVATFTDNQTAVASDFTAAIDWGDGTTTAGIVADDPTGGFEVLGSHTYTVGAILSMTVTVTDTRGDSNSSTAPISVAGAPVTGTAFPISTTEGNLTSGTIAQFTDSDPVVASITSYTATINWGDGSTSVGTLVPVATESSSPGVTYDVTGSHAYGAGDYAVSVTIKTSNNSSVTLSTTAIVADLPLSAVAVPVTVLEGTIFNGAVATFTDPDPRVPPPSNYTATIDWGDGTTAVGKVIINPLGPGYAVVGSDYFSAGKYSATVTIHDLGGSVAVVNPAITVPDAPLGGSGAKFSAPEGSTVRVQVATFTDADPVPHAGSFYTVAINWGDGTTSAGQVIPDGQGGYLVFGTHAYLAGTYTVLTTVTDTGGGAKTTIKGSATISASAITALPVAISASAGTPFLGVVATFTTPAVNLTASSFTAKISWGDGTTSAGTIKVNPAGGFEVIGSNTFATPETVPVSVSISSKSGAITSVASLATVKPGTITAEGVAVSGPERSAIGGVVAAFQSTDPGLTSSSFAATIDWGDGETTIGAISAVAGGFEVTGSHVYGLSGSYPVAVTIASTQGSGASASTTATVSYVAYPVLGGLSGLSTGGSTAPNITNQTDPIFSGQALAGSTVAVFAQIVGTQGVTEIGTTKVGPDGTWIVQSSMVLPSGAYNIFAQATDAGGSTGPLVTLMPSPVSGPLIIDTQGTRVTGLALQASKAAFQVGLSSGISGLDQASVLNPANYSVEYVAANGATSSVAVTGVSLASGSPGSGEQVLVQFGNGRKLKAGGYVLTIQAAGIDDNAGNSLSETYFVPYPAAYTAPGNDYQAEITTNGRATSAPQQFIPPSAAAGAKAHEAFIRAHLRSQRVVRKR